MLKEKISFQEDLPIAITVGDIAEYPIHFHDELELVYILRGRVNMRNGHYSYQLKEGDIFIFNDREIHSFERVGDEPNMVLLLHMDLDYFSKYYESLKNNFFVTDMDDDDDESLETLRNIVAKMMMELLKKGQGYEHRVIEKSHNLIGSLSADFKYFLLDDGKFVNEKKKKENKILAGRLSRITNYMYENYNRKLTLNEIAENEHLSLFYLSHVIKEATGLSFQDLLNFIRVEESEKLLLGTNKKMGAISEECGFSALRYFVKHFEQWFGMPPSEYREKFAGRISSRKSLAKLEKSSPGQIEEALREQVKGVFGDYTIESTIPPIIIEIEDPSQKIGKNRADKLIAQIEKHRHLVIAKPYLMFKEIGGIIIATGENYIISTNSLMPEKRTLYNILIYYADSSVLDQIDGAKTAEEIKQVIAANGEPKEFLVKIDGAKGQHEVTRYKIPMDATLLNLEYITKGREHLDERAKALRGLRTFPKVEIETIPSSETISIRSFLRCGEAELILIDEKSELA